MLKDKWPLLLIIKTFKKYFASAIEYNKKLVTLLYIIQIYFFVLNFAYCFHYIQKFIVSIIRKNLIVEQLIIQEYLNNIMYVQNLI